MGSKIYIAGKITGDENYKAKFAEAEDFYKKNGYTVLSPAVLPAGMRPEDYMRICFAMIDTADAVSFLPDYTRSEGALVEHAYCCYTDKLIRHYEEDNKDTAVAWLAVGKAAAAGIHTGLHASSKYVDVEQAVKKKETVGICDAQGNTNGAAEVIFIEDLYKMPAVALEEIRYGEWLFETIGGHKTVKCTACLHADGQFEPNGCMHYCPYCGARIKARIRR